MPKPNETPSTSDKMCSKCGTNPATGKGAWCKDCNAEYQRSYRIEVEQVAAEELQKAIELAKVEGFKEGARAMKAAIVREFSKVPPTGVMKTGEVASFVHGYPDVVKA